MRYLRRILSVIIGICIIGCVMLYSLYRASQSVPEFYLEALESEPASATIASDELQRHVLELRQELQHGENWELALTDEQVNGWLATDLPEKFPGLLPSQLEAPRVAFRDDAIRVACRVNLGKLKAVASFKLIPTLTEDPNKLAVRLSGVKAGRLPLPLESILAQVSTAASRSGIPLEWTNDAGDPVAVVTIPTERPELRRGVVVQSLTVMDGGFRVAGIADMPQRIAESSVSFSRDHR
ncbi:MAG: hypothetical protein KDA92_02820 [Planctomycetales bacterium]|nr:hypothetical protein [Planctomycetales bacterium]